jgi:hypothetical protein
VTAIVDIVLAVDDALRRARLPHAFGGALALAYGIDSPRGTADIDVNIFVPTTDAERVLRALPDATAWGADDLELLRRDGQVRVFLEAVPLDLFLNTDPFHDDTARAVRTVPFVDREIQVLDADHLAVFKAFFNRTKDWADIEAMVEAGSLHRDVVLGWVGQLLGTDDPRMARLVKVFETGQS